MNKGTVIIISRTIPTTTINTPSKNPFTLSFDL